MTVLMSGCGAAVWLGACWLDETRELTTDAATDESFRFFRKAISNNFGIETSVKPLPLALASGWVAGRAAAG